jgi:CelD/BcsL family acetyltransferase involved in cellulose biosynthesis
MRSPRAIGGDPGGSASDGRVDKKLQIEASADFQLVSASGCSTEVVREIAGFLDTQDTSHPFQFPQWAGKRASLALFRKESKLLWFAECGMFYPAGRVIRPIRALMLNRGPVCDDLQLLETGLRLLVEAGRRKGFAFIDMAPEWTGAFAESAAEMLGRNGWQPLKAGRSSLRLNLSPDLDHLVSKFRKVTRYEIRRSEREDVAVRMARDDRDHDAWLRLYLEMAREKEFAAEDSGHIRSVLRWLGSEPARGGLWLAHKGADLLGGIVVVRSGVRCWYVWGATSKGNKFSAGHLLQWRAIQWAKQQGCREYDFSGGEYREGVGDGTAFFKRGFCDNIVHFLPSHRQVISGPRIRVTNLLSKLRGQCRL